MRSISGTGLFGGVGFDTIIGSAGLFFRALIQAVYLVIVSRSIGVDGYGFFAGVVAVSILLSPLSGWGCSYVVTKKISAENVSANNLLIPVLIQVIGTGAFLVVLVVGVATLLDYSAFSMLMLIGVSELILLPIVLTLTNICIVLRKTVLAAMVACVVPAARLLSLFLALLFVSGDFTVETVCWSYFSGSLLGVVISVVSFISVVGLPERPVPVMFSDMLRSGGTYATNSAVSSGFMEVDKVIVLYFLGSVALGLYSLAFRVSSIFVLPIVAFGSVILPRILAEKGGGQWGGGIKILLFFPLMYGVIAGSMMWFLAPLVPLIFGNEFAESVGLLRGLSLWPILYGVRSCLGIGLVGVGLQSGRLLIELMGFFGVVLLNIFLIPQYGVISTIFSLILVELLMLIFLFYLLRGKYLSVKAL